MIYGYLVLTMIGAYLLGSVPFGILIAKAHGKDLRAIGSGNIGATNVSRALGRKWAYVCFGLDVLKGLAPTLAAMFLIRSHSAGSTAEKIALLWLKNKWPPNPSPPASRKRLPPLKASLPNCVMTRSSMKRYAIS